MSRGRFSRCQGTNIPTSQAFVQSRADRDIMMNTNLAALKDSNLSSHDHTIHPIITSLEALKLEIRGLSKSLDDLHERTTRLEEASFTPDVSRSASRSTRGRSRQEKSIGCDLQNRNSTIEADQNRHPPVPSEDNATITDSEARAEGDISQGILCGSNSACDIQRHLEPLEHNIATIVSSLARIEKFVRPSSRRRSTRTISPSQPASPAFTKDVPPSTNEGPPPSPNILEPEKFNRALDDPPPTAKKTPPVFGQPSTPVHTRAAQLNIRESPFGKYSDTQSPFHRLAESQSGPYGWWRARTPPLKDFKNGLSSNRSVGFRESEE